MNLRTILLACFCLFWIQDLIAQVYYIDRRFWHGKDAFRDEEQTIEFDLFPYSGPLLDMRGFQMMHPGIAGQVPEYIEIAPPDLSGLDNPAFAVAWIGVRNGEQTEGRLLLMLVGNFVDGQPRYYVDRNMDRVFVNDGDPVVFFPGHTREKLTFQAAGTDQPAFSFWLMAPEDFDEMQYRQEKKQRRVPHPDEVPEKLPTSRDSLAGMSAKEILAARKEDMARAPAVRRFGIRFGITFGLNRISYSYRKASSGFPVSYEVSNSAKGLFLNCNYRHRGFRVGLSGGLEHILWWSSFKTTRVSDPFEVCDPRTGHCYTVPGLEVERNRDRLPELRLNLGLNLEYLFELIPRVRFGPYLMPMISTYRPGHYLPEVALPERIHRMGPDISFEGGLRVEIRPLDNQAFMFSTCWNETRFRPQGFFEHEPDIRLSGLYTQFRGIRAYLGYSVLL